MSETQQQPSQRYAPPTAAVADVSDGGTTLAGRGVRFGAAMIDGLILLAIFWVMGQVTPLDIFSPAMEEAGLLTTLGVQALSLALFAALNGVLLAKSGQTIGKRLLGIRIVRSSGEAAAIGRILALRYGVGYLVAALHAVVLIAFTLIDSLMIFRADRRCLHDLIADTIVIKA